ncbi:MAG: CAP domain-containing protein, partial [Chloroflexota bacterium]
MHRLMILTALMLLALTFGASQPVAAQRPFDETAQVASVWTAINDWRVAEGVLPLTFNETLDAMAASQADYLMSLSRLPIGGDLHTGIRGEDVRARSQFPEFAWPTYGHPQRMLVTEIAGIGSVRSSMNFWRGSDIHRRNALDVRYREIGIAVRQLRGSSDLLYIVVLGAQPDVLTAVVDMDAEVLRLANERSGYQGDWIGTVTRFRLFDGQGRPVGDWQEWQPTISLPDIVGEFFILYEDAAGNQAIAQARVPGLPTLESEVFGADRSAPSVLSEISVAQAATSTPSPPGTPVPTSTTAPTNTPLPPTATPTPLVERVEVYYDGRGLTVYNPGDAPIDLTKMVLRGSGTEFPALRWQTVTSGLRLSALGSRECLQIYDFGGR